MATRKGFSGPRIRLEVRLDAADAPESLLDWIGCFDVPERFYFSGKEGDYEVAGLAAAEIISDRGTGDADKKLSAIWREHGDALVFGGVSFFSDGPAPGEWDGFGALRFTLPLVELRKKGGKVRVAVNGLVGDGQSREEALALLADRLAALDARFRPPCGKALPAVTADELIPGREGWDAMVSLALARIGAQEMEKAVLARKRLLSAPGPWPVLPLVRKLFAIRDSSFVFLYQISGDRAFLGRSPERLLRVNGRSISVDAIAGTRPRGADPASDQLWEKELRSSPKECREHGIVSDFIRRRMEEIAYEAAILDPGVVQKLQNVQHIFTRHTGTLRNGRSVLSTLRCFHPTPAVGGHPSEKALALIRSCEPYERGWFAAPVGWMDGREADFAVGIRSALVCGSDLHVYAGAGIVEGSEAEAEWRETEQKMKTVAGISEGC
ncbi:MAG: isochorismate synthase [Thermodesulfobacteriota bacterium]